VKLAKHLVVMVSVLAFLIEGFRALALHWLDPSWHPVSGFVENHTLWFGWTMAGIVAVWMLEVITTGHAVSIAWKARNDGDSTSEQSAAV